MNHAGREILDSIRRIVRSLRVSSRAAERDLGLSGAQLFVLQVLNGDDADTGVNGAGARRRALSVNELAERTLTHQSSVSVVVTRLEERGLVRRSPSGEDARRVEIALSPAGRRLARSAPAVAQERLRDAIDRLPRLDREELSRLLSALIREAGLTDEPASLFFEEETPKAKKTI